MKNKKKIRKAYVVFRERLLTVLKYGLLVVFNIAAFLFIGYWLIQGLVTLIHHLI
jgi:hypothetical protein